MEGLRKKHCSSDFEAVDYIYYLVEVWPRLGTRDGRRSVLRDAPQQKDWANAIHRTEAHQVQKGKGHCAPPD